MENPQIQQTLDYSIFNHINYNRDKNKRHIENIKKVLSQSNLLHLHPVLVNLKMEIIDGQHRFEAARELNLPVFYIQSDLSYDHILSANLFQKKLSLNDIIKFYALKDRLDPYIKIRDYLSLLELNPKSLLGLIFGTISRPMLELIKSGKFQMPLDMSKVERLIDAYIKLKEFIEQKRISPRSMFTSHDFTIAYRNLVTLNIYNETVFFNKLEQRWFDLKPQLNSKEWTKQLIYIYNWKNQNPIEYNVSKEN